MTRNVFLLALFLFLSANASAQHWQWETGSDCRTNGVMEAAPIAIDNAGNLYESGLVTHYGTSSDSLVSTFGPFSVVDSDNTGFQSILVSTDSNGNYRWVLAAQNGQCEFGNIVADSFGNIYLVGESVTPNFDFGGVHFFGHNFLAKVDSSGHLLWMKSCADAFTLSINSTGYLYLAGTFNLPTYTIGSVTLNNTDIFGGTSDVFVAKYDSSGNPVWAKNFGGAGNDAVATLAITNDSEIYVGGVTYSETMIIGPDTLRSTGAQTPFVVKLDMSGNPLWGSEFNPADTGAYIFGIAADAYNNVYATGSCGHSFMFGNDTLSGMSAFLVRFDSTGVEKWARSNYLFSGGFSVIADNCSIWLSGLLTGGGDPIYLAEYNANGDLLDTVFVSSGADEAYSNYLAVDHKGNLFIGGDFSYYGPVYSGADTFGLYASAVEALYVLKYKYDSTGPCVPDTMFSLKTQQVALKGLSLYPNPASLQCTITSDFIFNEGSSIEINDITGRLVRSYPLSGTHNVIPVSDLAPGIYECQLYNKGVGTETKKLVIVK